MDNCYSQCYYCSGTGDVGPSDEVYSLNLRDSLSKQISSTSKARKSSSLESKDSYFQKELEIAIDEVKVGKLQKGICRLTNVAYQVRPPDKLYYSANIWLVRAYKDSGQLPEAIRLCRQLATNPYLRIQVWTQKAFPVLQQLLLSSNSKALKSSSKLDNSSTIISFTEKEDYEDTCPGCNDCGGGYDYHGGYPLDKCPICGL